MSTQTEVAETLMTAAALVEALPEHLQAAAFTEAIRLLTLPQGHRYEIPRELTESANPPPLPPAALVKQRGSRLQKVLFAVASLTTESQPATSVAIERFLRERLASPVSKVTDVLRAGVPEYLDRTKDGSLFEYRCTTAGLAQLRALHQLHEP